MITFSYYIFFRSLQRIFNIFALLGSLLHKIGICHPSKGLELIFISLSAMLINAIEICSPVETIMSYSYLHEEILKFSANISVLEEETKILLSKETIKKMQFMVQNLQHLLSHSNKTTFSNFMVDIFM